MTVYLGIKNKRRWSRIFRKSGTCETNLTVKIPSSFAIDARSNDGNLSIEGIEGDVTVATGSGEVTLNDVKGKVAVHTKSGMIKGNVESHSVRCTTLRGDIELSGLTGSLTCKSGSGDVTLEWLKIPEVATVDLGVGKGALNVRLPRSTKLNYQFIIGLASIMNEFKNEPDSDFKMRVVSKRGPLSLKKAIK
jgi:DUF4097 and DUF4098 domain-containing protein YvlB